jgi:hypothetical protein
MMVRMSLPLAVLRSKLSPRLGQDANLPAVQIVERLDELRPPAA